MIPAPEKISGKKDGSVVYKFPWNDYKGERDGAYYVKGAIAFPMLVESSQRAEGWIICAAQELRSGEIVIMADTKWYSIDTIIEDNKILHYGLDQWFIGLWAKYGCQTFYHSDKIGTAQQYIIQISRNDNIKPSPWLPEVELYDQDDAINKLYAWRTRGRLVIEENGRLLNQLLLWEQTGKKHMLPGVQALLTLVAAYERYPHMKQEEEL